MIEYVHSAFSKYCAKGRRDKFKKSSLQRRYFLTTIFICKSLTAMNIYFG